MLKKTIRRLGALAMVLAMAVSVFAVNASAADALNSLNKAYETTAGASVSKANAPREHLKFNIVEKTADDSNVYTATDLPDISVEKAADADAFTVTLPDYDANAIGKFTYKMQEEVDGTAAAGVIYNTDYIYVVVQRTWVWNEKNEKSVKTVYAIQNSTQSKKLGTITNKFDAGSLKVTKELAGDFANYSDTFKIKVVLSKPTGKIIANDIFVNDTKVTPEEWAADGTYTVEKELGHDESYTITNIPVGVTYTVTEVNSGSYEASYVGETGTIAADTKASATVTNTKNSSTPTGVIMTIAPYALMVVLAGVFAVVFLSRRNRAE